MNQLDPRLNERNYTKPTKFLKNSYFEECLQQFKAKVTRVRLVRLKAGCLLPAHIDYDPSFAVRILVPVQTNEFCVNYIWRRAEIESTYMKADGRPWFLNTGFPHGVGNYGQSDRITLMISLTGQEDLEEIGDYKWDSSSK